MTGFNRGHLNTYKVSTPNLVFSIGDRKSDRRREWTHRGRRLYLYKGSLRVSNIHSPRTLLSKSSLHRRESSPVPSGKLYVLRGDTRTVRDIESREGRDRDVIKTIWTTEGNVPSVTPKPSTTQVPYLRFQTTMVVVNPDSLVL